VTDSEQAQMAVFSPYDTEPDFLGQMNNYKLFKEDPAP
jgi:hypothetical protein